MVCGGIHPTLDPDCIYEIPELNAIVRGEGEYAMSELADALACRRDYHGIENLWLRNNNEIIKNQIRPLIKCLDQLPFPDKSSFDYQRQIDQARGLNRFIFSRGCVYNCTYCSNKVLQDIYKGEYFRLLSVQKAIREIELDENKFRFRSIFFDDDTITLDSKWFYDFFTLYKKKFKYPFFCNIRAELINESQVKLLKDAGCICVGIGVEHGDENFRKTVLKKDITNQQIINTFKLFKKQGISCYAQVMVGLPFENKKLFLETVKLVRQIQVAKKFIYIFSPYPGTELAKICQANNWLPNIQDYREREKAVINYPGFSRKEIQFCHDIFPALLRFKFIPLRIVEKWSWAVLLFIPLEIISRCDWIMAPFYKLSEYFKGLMNATDKT